MFGLGITELLIILVIIILLFGVGRIATIGRDLGKSIRGFREGLAGMSKRIKKKRKNRGWMLDVRGWRVSLNLFFVNACDTTPPTIRHRLSAICHQPPTTAQ